MAMTESSLHILMTGASGFIGRAATAHLEALGHRVTPLRRPKVGISPAGCWWRPEHSQCHIDPETPFDAVIHLAGENIAVRWTEAKKRRILESRRQGTRLLCETMARWSPPPRVLISASGVGYYGDRGAEVLSEDSSRGTGFLAEVSQAWEQEAAPACAAGIRVTHMRLGMVLDGRGGALPQMLTLFRLGLGGRMGNGQQYWSWIALEDVPRVLLHLLESKQYEGPVNACAPEPVTNREFTRTLARVLHRPALFPAPAFMLRMALGEMADGLLLSSQRVQPARLLQGGFQFRYSNLEGALHHVISTRG
jgi:uncharacterized protein (TIGR01777 family)